jgi:hypothetical protein
MTVAESPNADLCLQKEKAHLSEPVFSPIRDIGFLMALTDHIIAACRDCELAWPYLAATLYGPKTPFLNESTDWSKIEVVTGELPTQSEPPLLYFLLKGPDRQRCLVLGIQTEALKTDSMKPGRPIDFDKFFETVRKLQNQESQTGLLKRILDGHQSVQ